MSALPASSRFEPSVDTRFRVLVIGDDPIHERHFRAELGKAHLEDCVLFIEDHRVALQALNARHGPLLGADLYAIILNLDATQLGWTDILRQLDASHRTSNIPVIFMSDMPHSWGERELAEWKILECLPRPIRVESFGDVVSRAFHARNARMADVACIRHV